MVQGFPASVPLNKNVRPETCWAAPRPASLGQSLCTEGGGGKGFTGSPVPATKCLLKSFVCTLSLPVSSTYLTLLLLPLYWFPLRVLCNNPKGKLSTPASSLPPDFYHGSLYAVPPAPFCSPTSLSLHRALLNKVSRTRGI